MSRISKQPITIPDGVTVTFDGSVMIVKGPKGQLSKILRDDVSVEIIDNTVVVSDTQKTMFTKALVGTYASHIKNMITGVTNQFTKKLILEGVGYKVNVSGNSVDMALGFSHPVKVEIPVGITASTEKNTLTMTGSDKELVGQFSAKIRSLKKPEPYKGKGFRYENEIIRRKEGKKNA